MLPESVRNDMNILGISGSSRTGSYNGALLEAAKEFLPDNTSIEIFDVSKFPLYTQDLDRNVPREVQMFKQKIKKADAILFATPEHNYSITAVLKNAIEWGNRPPGNNSWDGKPAAIIGASSGPRGTARAQLQLRQIMVDLNMYPINRPLLLLHNAADAFNKDRRLIDENFRETLKGVLQSLVDWTTKLNQKQ